MRKLMSLRMREAAKRHKMHARMAAYKRKEANKTVVKV